MNSAPKGKMIAASMIGNVLEWYDFAIYGNFAAAIGRNFFPHEDGVAQVLAAFGVFAIGYLMRPIGGAVIGYIGDYYSRRAALNVSITAMAVPTFLMGVLPGYETLGLLAPVALVQLRAIQGLSVGGEYISSMVFLVERAPVGHRGLMGAVACCGTTLGLDRFGSCGGGHRFDANRDAQHVGLAHPVPTRNSGWCYGSHSATEPR
jgi:MHS family proline/betaine transporter-like MFS transporter